MAECRQRTRVQPPGGAVDPSRAVQWQFRDGDEPTRLWDWTLGTPPIRRLRSVRSPNSTAVSRHVPVHAHSRITGGLVHLESGLEHDLLRDLERRADVSWIVAQPVRLAFPTPVGDRPRWIRHVPDLLTEHRDGSIMVWDARAPERRDEKFADRARLTDAACAEVGWGYELFGGHPAVYRTNLMWLHSYRMPRPWYPPATEHLRPLICAPDASIGTVLTADRGSGHLISTMWHLIWAGTLECDLHSRLTRETVLRPSPAAAGPPGLCAGSNRAED